MAETGHTGWEMWSVGIRICFFELFLCNLLVGIRWVFQAAPTSASSCLQASCQWFHGDALELNTPTTKPTLTLWRRSMQSLINQVFPVTTLLTIGWGLGFCHIDGFNLRLSCSGSTITAEIQGVIDACVKLTGMPDLTLSFMVSFLSPVCLDVNFGRGYWRSREICK